jgi:hypothetical protein
VTLWWFFITQWFFGPPIIDRSFMLTGGQCELLKEAQIWNVDMGKTRMFVSSAACKLAGGKWKGGHDISGHVFLLVLGSAFLWMEVLHVLLRATGSKDERVIVGKELGPRNEEVEGEAAEVNKHWDLGVKIMLGTALFFWWMLLMTAAYFHTWLEKASDIWLVAL